jgi:hypothetical protein
MSPSDFYSRAPQQPDYDDPGAQKEADATAKMREARLRSVEAAILATTEGREWLWSILAKSNCMGDRLVLENAFQNGHFYGGVDLGLFIVRSLARTSPADFARMLAEHDKT